MTRSTMRFMCAALVLLAACVPATQTQSETTPSNQSHNPSELDVVADRQGDQDSEHGECPANPSGQFCANIGAECSVSNEPGPIVCRCEDQGPDGDGPHWGCAILPIPHTVGNVTASGAQ